MTVLWNSAAFSADVRAAALRDTIRAQVVRVELDLPSQAERVQVQVGLSPLGRMQLCSVTAMPTTVTRTPRSARADDEEPALFVTLQASGSSLMIQHGRQATLVPGQFAVYATTTPYTLVFDQGVDAHFFRIPLRDLALPEAVVREVSARPLGAVGDDVGALASSYLMRLATTPNLLSRPASDTLAVPTIELIRAALTNVAGPEELTLDARAASLQTQIIEYIRSHLADSGLSSAAIAEANHVSIRHLYTLLSQAGISLGEWIRTERLERCRTDLAQPGMRGLTIAAVAARWGFVDATHFARVFRDAYGLAPREWRELRLGRTPV